MKISTIAKRYAQALLQIAQEKDTIDLYEKELNDILASIDAEEHLGHIWYSERILSDNKKAAIKELFQGKISDTVLNFLFVLIDKNREGYISEIFRAYKNFADVSRNILHAEVRSVVELTDRDFQELQDKLSAMTNKNVRLKVQIDPSLIGGLVVKVGDKVLDGSVVKRLSVMKKRLEQVQFSKIGVRD